MFAEPRIVTESLTIYPGLFSIQPLEKGLQLSVQAKLVIRWQTPEPCEELVCHRDRRSRHSVQGYYSYCVVL